VNVSVRRPGEEELRTKVEVKNLNSFRHVEAAIEREIARQVAAYEAGDERGFPVQETRLYDPERDETRTMRSKEDAEDYRYFPEPDLPPLVIADSVLADQRGRLPELPAARRERYATGIGLSEYDAGVLTADRAVADFFEATLRAGAPAKAAANWIANQVLAALGDGSVAATSVDELPMQPRDLATVIALVDEGALSTAGAKKLVAHLVAHGGDPRRLVDELGLAQVGDAATIEAWCREALAAKPQVAEAVRAGNDKAVGAAMGAVMQRSGGRADPGRVRETLLRLIRAGE
jgi:aspartyl-tRNA(Asn)/glutamyl-tRNA(Gln) amidotransferase subunit B